MNPLHKNYCCVVWSVIGTLSLIAPACAQTFEQAMEQVYQTNPTLAAERAHLREVDEAVEQALGNYRPTVDAQGSVGKIYQATPNNPFEPPASALTTNTVGVQVTQPVFRGFRTMTGVSASEKQVYAERANLQNVEQQVLLDTGTSYLDVVRDQVIVELNHNFVNVLNRRAKETHDRFSAKDVTLTDVDQSDMRLKRAEASLRLAEVNLANERANFGRLTGVWPTVLKQPQLKLPPVNNLENALAVARKYNPMIMASSFNTAEAKDEVALSKEALLPEVNLVASAQRQWGVSSFIPGRQDTVQVLAQMTIPIYHEGTDYSKTRSALQTVTERDRKADDARRQVEQSVIAAWETLKAARDVIVANKGQVESAMRALRGVMKEVPAGTRTTLDELNAEQELLEANINLTQAQHDEAVAILRLRAALGTLTAKEMGLSVPLYDPSVHYEAVRNKWIGFDSPDGEQDLRKEEVKEPIKPDDKEGQQNE